MAHIDVAERVSLGEASNKTAGTTLTLTTVAGAPPFSVIVVRSAYDNTTTGTTAPAPTATVSGGTGITWTTEIQRGSGSAAAAGVAASIATGVTGAAGLPAGSVITLTLSASVTAKAMAAAAVPNAIRSAVTPTSNGAVSGTAPTVSISPTAAGQAVIAFVARENNVASAVTNDTDTTNGVWDPMADSGTTGGNAQTNVAFVGGMKVVTAAGAQSYDQTIGSTDWVALAIVLAPNPNALDAPAGLTVGAVTGFSDRLQLSWTAPTGTPDSYRIERDGVVIVTGHVGTTYTDTGRSPVTAHTYRVQAVKNTVFGDWSSGVAGTTPPGAPGAPTATATSAVEVTVTWGGVAGATGYDIERNGTVVATNHGGTTFGDTGLTAETLYTYRIRSRSASGAGEWSPTGQATTLGLGQALVLPALSAEPTVRTPGVGVGAVALVAPLITAPATLRLATVSPGPAPPGVGVMHATTTAVHTPLTRTINTVVVPLVAAPATVRTPPMMWLGVDVTVVAPHIYV